MCFYAGLYVSLCSEHIYERRGDYRLGLQTFAGPLAPRLTSVIKSLSRAGAHRYLAASRLVLSDMLSLLHSQNGYEFPGGKAQRQSKVGRVGLALDQPRLSGSGVTLLWRRDISQHASRTPFYIESFSYFYSFNIILYYCFYIEQSVGTPDHPYRSAQTQRRVLLLLSAIKCSANVI